LRERLPDGNPRILLEDVLDWNEVAAVKAWNEEQGIKASQKEAERSRSSRRK